MTCLKLQVSRDKGVGESSWCWPAARHPWHQLPCQEVVRERERATGCYVGKERAALHDSRHGFSFVSSVSGVFKNVERIGHCYSIHSIQT